MKTILHVLDITSPPETVFSALTAIDGLAQWWTTKVTGDAGPEGLIDFGGFDPDMRVPSRVGWQCVGGVEQWADNTFGFEIAKRDDGGTRLRFRQDYATELGDDDYGSYNFDRPGGRVDPDVLLSVQGLGPDNRAAVQVGSELTGDRDGNI